MAKIAVWQVAFYTVFVFALPTYLHDIPWEAYLVAYIVMLALWVVAVSELKRWWRSFSRRYFHSAEKP